jgi:hypothetical protein
MAAGLPERNGSGGAPFSRGLRPLASRPIRQFTALMAASDGIARGPNRRPGLAIIDGP